MLLNKGADIHTINNHGDTALILANAMGRTEIVKLLEEAIEIKQTVKGHKQEAMELVRQRDVKIPSLRTIIHRQLPTYPTTEINESVFMLPPSKLGGKRKTRKSKKSTRKKRKTKK